MNWMSYIEHQHQMFGWRSQSCCWPHRSIYQHHPWSPDQEWDWNLLKPTQDQCPEIFEKNIWKLFLPAKIFLKLTFPEDLSHVISGSGLASASQLRVTVSSLSVRGPSLEISILTASCLGGSRHMSECQGKVSKSHKNSNEIVNRPLPDHDHVSIDMI